MKTTLSVIKADIGSIGGHIAPSKRLLERVKEVVGTSGKSIITTITSVTPAMISPSS